MSHQGFSHGGIRRDAAVHGISANGGHDLVGLFFLILGDPDRDSLIQTHGALFRGIFNDHRMTDDVFQIRDPAVILIIGTLGRCIIRVFGKIALFTRHLQRMTQFLSECALAIIQFLLDLLKIHFCHFHGESSSVFCLLNSRLSPQCGSTAVGAPGKKIPGSCTRSCASL